MERIRTDDLLEYPFQTTQYSETQPRSGERSYIASIATLRAFLDLYFNQFIIFMLVLTRISGLVMVAPFFGSRSVPLQIRGLLAVALAVMITPLHWTTPLERPNSVVELTVLMGQEVAIGMSIGLAVMIIFTGLQMTGQIIGQMSGMQLADIFDPTFDNSVPVFAQLLMMVTLAVFLLIGGHRETMGALLDTFRVIPPGQVDFSLNFADTLTDLITMSFAAGIRAAAPVALALLLSIIVLGLISRTLPQLNVIAVGFSLNTLVMLATLSITLGSAVWVFQHYIELGVDQVTDMFDRKLSP